MKRQLLRSFMCGGSVLALVLSATPASAVKLFSATDNILAIDTDPTISGTPAHGNENANKVVDQVFVAGMPDTGSTKYLNFARVGSGFIVTPTVGLSNVQSLQLRAANDAAGRDPLTYTLYGTTDPIVSDLNSTGLGGELWIPISTGVTGLGTDPGRHSLGSVQDIVNGASFTSYKMIFNSIRDITAGNSDSMQVADVQFFTDLGGGGTPLLSVADGPATIAIADQTGSASRYPSAGESPSRAFDALNNTKYLNFAKENSGVILSRADGARTLVESITLVTGGDAPDRDPMTWQLYGTDDPLLSTVNSRGNLENWTLIDSDTTGLDVDPGRGMVGLTIPVDSTLGYLSYRLVFPTLRNAGATNSMQVSEIILDGQLVPEPSSFLMIGMAVTALGVVARRRNSGSA